MKTSGWLLMVLAAAAAAAAHSQTATDVSRPTAPTAWSAHPAVSVPVPRISLVRPYDRGDGAESKIVARTEIDHRFAPDGLVGSVGYLCGISEMAPRGGAGGGPASTFGQQGTYLGASLGYAFR